VTTNGIPLLQSADTLADTGQLPRESVTTLLDRLIDLSIVRRDPPRTEGGPEIYEVTHDALASALLEWLSQYVVSQTRSPCDQPAGRSLPAAPKAPLFPCQLMADRLRDGKTLPFPGAGTSLSALRDPSQPSIPSPEY